MLENTQKFKLGEVVVTAAVHAWMEQAPENAARVNECLVKHATGDWGCIGQDSKESNEAAIKEGEENQIMSAYTLDPSMGESQGYGDNTLWIITEWDRSVTTILFPEDY